MLEYKNWIWAAAYFKFIICNGEPTCGDIFFFMLKNQLSDANLTANINLTSFYHQCYPSFMIPKAVFVMDLNAFKEV
mgnify:CR=1 FL=1